MASFSFQLRFHAIAQPVGINIGLGLEFELILMQENFC